MISKIVLVTSTAVISLAAGSVLGYRYAKHQLGMEFEELLALEAKELEEYYSKAHKSGIFETPESAAAHLIPKDAEDFEDEVTVQTLERVVTGLRYNGKPDIEKDELSSEEDPEDFDEEEVVQDIPPIQRDHNIFERIIVPEIDYADEIAARDPDFPYIISEAEFHENEDYTEVTLSYFQGDNKVVNGKSELLTDDDVDGLIGKENLLKFGHRSGDDNILYIRLDRIGMIFEVIRSMGTYAHEVLGQDSPVS
jgi:hypothetical protein